jgi:hypothetical protein
MARLPVPRPPAGSPVFEELVGLSKSIAKQGLDNSTSEYARLNAIAAIEYGIDRDQYRYVLGTFPLIDAAVRSRSLDDFALLDRTVLPRLQ